MKEVGFPHRMHLELKQEFISGAPRCSPKHFEKLLAPSGQL